MCVCVRVFLKLIIKLYTQNDSMLTTSMPGTTKVWKHIRVIFACFEKSRLLNACVSLT